MPSGLPRSVGGFPEDLEVARAVVGRDLDERLQVAHQARRTGRGGLRRPRRGEEAGDGSLGVSEVVPRLRSVPTRTS